MRAFGIIQGIKTNWMLFRLLFCVALISVLFNPGLHKWWNFRQVQYQFRNEMDPAKVQKWATNVLAQHYRDKNIHLYPRGAETNVLYAYPGWYGTYLPPGASNMVVKHLCRPEVEVHSDHVVVFGGGSGQPELWVGATNYVYENDRAKMWRPGVCIVIPEEFYKDVAPTALRDGRFEAVASCLSSNRSWS
jgi:hypothetical protein